MDNTNLATEILAELKRTCKRWFIAFLVVLFLWFSTIGIFIYYISLPDNAKNVHLKNTAGYTTYVGRDLSGGSYNGEDYRN